MIMFTACLLSMLLHIRTLVNGKKVSEKKSPVKKSHGKKVSGKKGSKLIFDLNSVFYHIGIWYLVFIIYIDRYIIAYRLHTC